MSINDVIPTSPAVFVLGDGRELAIKPYTIGQLPEVLKQASAIFESGALSGDDPNWGAVVAAHTDKATRLVSISAGVPLDQVEAMAIDEFSDLLALVVEVNADFFIHRVAPKLEQITARLEQLAGRKLSSD